MLDLEKHPIAINSFWLFLRIFNKLNYNVIDNIWVTSDELTA